MKRTVEDIKNEFIDHIGEKAERFGLPKIAGLMEGLLLLTDGRLSLDEMADRLEVSKASVSTNIRLLERWKVVRRVFNRGDRKNYYEIAGDLWEIETEIMSTIAKEELEKGKRLLERSASDLGDMTADDAAETKEIEFVRRRLKELSEYVEAAEHLLRVVLREGKVTAANIKKIDIS
jgi:DNA-binding transcriptional regulator GbsR (MarR family)